VPHDKRVQPLYGEKEDAGKWYRCWNCGFPIDSTKTALGGNAPNQGVVPIAVDGFLPNPVLSGIPFTYELSLDGDTGGIVLEELGPDGTPKPIRYDFMPDVVAGCPFCGCMNWR
jgi:hypothetical protein